MFKGGLYTQKFFSIIGYLILVFIILSNYVNINLSDRSVIILGILSAIFMCIGILIKDKNEK